MIEIELGEPTYFDCDCCGGRTVSLTRFVHKDGNAHAIYYARFGEKHPERNVSAVVSIGEWGEGSDPSRRVAFPLRLRTSEKEHQVSLVDPEECPWNGSKFLGRFLTRAEALEHPLKEEVFHITDHMVEQDQPLKAYLDQE